MATARNTPQDELATYADQAARLLKNLANTHRLSVLCALVSSGRELSVTELLNAIPLSGSALSQHLARLREDNLVTTRRDSQTIYYRVVEGPALKIIKVLQQHYCSTAQEDD
ncbi:helix-turn-helix transcriptional regulator [Bowmanella sp. JS7-9]|uniref:ArsR/SmtB family transcription factor n=1 Tax=Pseudobowmanella zhangzhouensis TaxID=1537679 RepID=A0ABW1XJH1_9ALTE|nr:metalloregulator ArsR/SmtB family transcription factor [Bowmanella sp. JS7-9]TBX23178.1 hypothetical protein TK45_08195 [Bowmanella sp. JS7-9]